MRAVGRHAQHHIAGLNVVSGDDVGFFHHAHGESGQVIFADRVFAGHFRSFAADQRTTGLIKAERDAVDDFGSGGHVEFAAGKIIQEKQRLSTLYQNVVDAHADQVDADGVVNVEFKGKFQFGANTVRAGYQHRFLVL